MGRCVLAARFLAVAGKKTEAQQILNDLQQLQEQRYVSPYTVAAIYAGLGDQDPPPTLMLD